MLAERLFLPFTWRFFAFSHGDGAHSYMTSINEFVVIGAIGHQNYEVM